jgi:hypothetical protein
MTDALNPPLGPLLSNLAITLNNHSYSRPSFVSSHRNALLCHRPSYAFYFSRPPLFSSPAFPLRSFSVIRAWQPPGEVSLVPGGCQRVRAGADCPPHASARPADRPHPVTCLTVCPPRTAVSRTPVQSQLAQMLTMRFCRARPSVYAQTRSINNQYRTVPQFSSRTPVTNRCSPQLHNSPLYLQRIPHNPLICPSIPSESSTPPRNPVPSPRSPAPLAPPPPSSPQGAPQGPPWWISMLRSMAVAQRRCARPWAVGRRSGTVCQLSSTRATRAEPCAIISGGHAKRSPSSRWSRIACRGRIL